MPTSVWMWAGLIVLWLVVLLPLIAARYPAIKKTTDIGLSTRILHRGGRPVTSRRRRLNVTSASTQETRRSGMRATSSVNDSSRAVRSSQGGGTDETAVIEKISRETDGSHPAGILDAPTAAAQVGEGTSNAGIDAEVDTAASGSNGSTKVADDDAAFVLDDAEFVARPASPADTTSSIVDAEVVEESTDGVSSDGPVVDDADMAHAPRSESDSVGTDENVDTDAAQSESEDPSSIQQAPAVAKNSPGAADVPEAEDLPPARSGRGGFDPDADARLSQARYRIRQRTLLILAAISLIMVVAALVTTTWMWIPAGLALAVLVLYLAGLRRSVRAEQEIRRRRMQRLARQRERERREREEEEAQDFAPQIVRRRHGAVVVEFDDEDVAFEHLGYYSAANQRGYVSMSAEPPLRRAVS